MGCGGGGGGSSDGGRIFRGVLAQAAGRREIEAAGVARDGIEQVVGTKDKSFVVGRQALGVVSGDPIGMPFDGPSFVEIEPVGRVEATHFLLREIVFVFGRYVIDVGRRGIEAGAGLGTQAGWGVGLGAGWHF
jgi:hypothetical protein